MKIEFLYIYIERERERGRHYCNIINSTSNLVIKIWMMSKQSIHNSSLMLLTQSVSTFISATAKLQKKNYIKKSYKILITVRLLFKKKNLLVRMKNHSNKPNKWDGILQNPILPIHKSFLFFFLPFPFTVLLLFFSRNSKQVLL